MPPKGPVPGSPEDWLRHANSDLEIARSAKSKRVLLEQLCFHAQQAAEKAIKAVLVSRGISVPKTHNIKLLIGLLAEDIELTIPLLESPILSDYSVTGRYPGDVEPVSKAEHRHAVELAESVVRWAEGAIVSASQTKQE